MRNRPWSQYFLPDDATILVGGHIQALFRAGETAPFSQSVPSLRIAQGGTEALAEAPEATSDAEEFEPVITEDGDAWTLGLDWDAEAVAELERGTYDREIEVTSEGAANSPVTITVRLIVL